MSRAAIVCCLVLTACEGELIGVRPPLTTPPSLVAPTELVPPSRTVQAPQTPLAEVRATVSGAQAVAFARRVAPMLIGRVPTPDELARLSMGGGTALRELLEAWTTEPGFAEAARDWISVKLKASGSGGGIDGDLPGNLAAYLVKNGRPHAELLTAQRCYGRDGAPRACDTGAPFTAGVLTTRAFLKNTASRFNLKRARTVVKTFACSDYPMDHALQPPIERERLIPLFQVDQTNDSSAGTFGNGHACYACHSQFSAHAQPFVKFDDQGRYQANATGLQDPALEQGRSTASLFTSHFTGAAAASEHSQIFGQQVQNLAEAARVISSSRLYLECSARSFSGYVLALSESEANALPADVVSEAVSEALARSSQPTLASLVVELFSHPSMMQARRPGLTVTP
ncbi:MAG: DUF1588 domain-containing protein [Myxococcaceae bacterium]|jgi:hypothetical protein|nr:DUF1588 domain-containing protein [Myxococcaceae bacterium]